MRTCFLKKCNDGIGLKKLVNDLKESQKVHDENIVWISKKKDISKYEEFHKEFYQL